MARMLSRITRALRPDEQEPRARNLWHAHVHAGAFKPGDETKVCYDAACARPRLPFV